MRYKNEEKNKDEIIKAYKTTNDFLTKTATIVLSFTAVICTSITIISGLEIYQFESKMRNFENAEKTTRYMIMAEKTNSFEEKINYYSLAINYDKENDFLYCERAKLYYDMDINNLVLQDCSKAIKINETNFDAYYIRGKTYFKNKQYESAIDDFLKCVATDAEQINSYIGFSYYYLKQYEKATYYFDKYWLSIPPDEIDGWEARESISDCYLKNKDYDKAIQSLSLLLDICKNQKHIETITEKLITIYNEQNDFDSVKILSDMRESMYQQYKQIQQMSFNTVNIRGIETYQILFHELDIRINNF